MKISKDEKSSKQAKEKITKSSYDFQLFFCSSCLQFPEYEINIDSSGNVTLSHKCIDSVISIKLSELKDFHSKIYNKPCEYCQSLAYNICFKCRKFICDNCIQKHEQPKGIINIEYFEKLVIPIIKCQNYCKEHLQEITHYCNICKMNLCEEYCIKEHCHCKCESLASYKGKVSPSGYNGANQTLNQLADIARAFNDCFLYSSKNSQMTINIILNHHLIEPINKYINETLNKETISKKEAEAKEKMESKIIITKETTIRNNFKIPKENVPYLFNSFRDKNFNSYYKDLIGMALGGDIESFHKLMEIINHYKKSEEDNEIFTSHHIYTLSLKYSLEKEIKDLSYLSLEREIKEFPFILLDTKNQLNKLQTHFNQIELDFEMLQKFVILIDYRVDYKLRRKIGNIIAKKLINLYNDKIDKIELTEYLLGLTVEDLENKIRKIQNKIKFDSKNQELKEKLDMLIDKYKDALNKLQNLAKNKLNNIKNKKNPTIKKVNNSIAFSNNTNDESEIKEVCLLNLFFIIKKKISEFFSQHIHNELLLLNKIATESVDKYENGKDKEELKIEEEKEHSQSIINNIQMIIKIISKL